MRVQATSWAGLLAALAGLIVATGCHHDLDRLRAGDGGTGDGGIDGSVADASADASCACHDGIECTTDTCLDDGGCEFIPDNAGCDDGVACTDDVCHPGDGCSNLPSDAAGTCDDDNECTDDTCDPEAPGADPATGCSHMPNGGTCDDGTFCNGVDMCDGGGTCAPGSTDPCPGMSTCDEGMRMCTGCMTDGDCPTDLIPAWGPCMGFSDECDEDGMQMRTVTRYSCTGGECVPDSMDEMQTCTRDTEGAGCTSDSNGCTRDVCAGGTCTHPNKSDGASCRAGASSYRCCGGSCVWWTEDPDNCGACGISCPTGSCTNSHCRCMSAMDCPSARPTCNMSATPARCE